MLREEEEKVDEEKLGGIVKQHVQHKQILLSDLPEDLIAEILSRVPLSSLRSIRSTCKKWNVLSRNLVIGKLAEAKNQLLKFLIRDFRICALRINLYDGDDFANLSVKQVSRLHKIKISKAHHCDGLLLCVLRDNSGLLVWNPYLGQRRRILRNGDKRNLWNMFTLGYDNNRNHKILEIFLLSKRTEFSSTVYGFNIYEFSSNSWRSIDVTFNRQILTHVDPVTLKGNVYFITQEAMHMEYFLFCFDFTSERFGPRLSLPSHSCRHADVVLLSCVRDEQLVILHQSWENYWIMEIWVTNKMDYNEVLWTKWMKIDMNLVPGFDSLLIEGGLIFNAYFGNIFIDEENKVAVVFGRSLQRRNFKGNQTALIIGQDGSSKSIDVRGTNVIGYFPSLVKIRSGPEPRRIRLSFRISQFLENFRASKLSGFLGYRE